MSLTLNFDNPMYSLTWKTMISKKGQDDILDRTELPENHSERDENRSGREVRREHPEGRAEIASILHSALAGSKWGGRQGHTPP